MPQRETGYPTGQQMPQTSYCFSSNIWQIWTCDSPPWPKAKQNFANSFTEQSHLAMLSRSEFHAIPQHASKCYLIRMASVTALTSFEGGSLV